MSLEFSVGVLRWLLSVTGQDNVPRALTAFSFSVVHRSLTASGTFKGNFSGLITLKKITPSTYLLNQKIAKTKRSLVIFAIFL